MVDAVYKPYAGSDEKPATDAQRTPRWVWFSIWLVWAVSIALRSPVLYRDVKDRLAGTSMPAELNDPHLQSLAVNIGFAAALLLATFFCIAYLAIGASLDKRLFAPRGTLPRSSRVGVMAQIAFLAMVPVQVFLAVVNSPAARNQPLLPVYLLAVAALVALAYRRSHACGRNDFYKLAGIATVYALISMAF